MAQIWASHSNFRRYKKWFGWLSWPNVAEFFTKLMREPEFSSKTRPASVLRPTLNTQDGWDLDKNSGLRTNFFCQPGQISQPENCREEVGTQGMGGNDLFVNSMFLNSKPGIKVMSNTKRMRKAHPFAIRQLCPFVEDGVQ